MSNKRFILTADNLTNKRKIFALFENKQTYHKLMLQRDCRQVEIQMNLCAWIDALNQTLYPITEFEFRKFQLSAGTIATFATGIQK